MKRKALFLAVLALGGLAAGPVAAQEIQTCRLELLTASNPIAVGQPYSLRVTLQIGIDFGPPPPANFQYNVIFHGTRNGVWDTGSGQHLMNVMNASSSTASTWNPGGVAGQYVRYAEIRAPYPYNNTLCYTNVIVATLL